VRFSNTFEASRLADALHPAAHRAARARRPLSMAKVMVVDDAYSELKLMESILRNAGHQVVSLIDGEALEDKVSQERPDVLLLDIILPKRNGFEILRSLKKNERTKGTPIVLVSSKNQESDKAWGKRQGADDYLPKPFTSDQLLTMVGRFVR
jgi:DNA-binding response OmpR family regulator